MNFSDDLESEPKESLEDMEAQAAEFLEKYNEMLEK